MYDVMKRWCVASGALLLLCANVFSDAGDERFLGGAIDGHAASLWLHASPTNLAGRERFRGGVQDGSASASYRTFDRLSVVMRFSGGPYDGHAFFLAASLPNPLQGDTDADGLPDWWEILYHQSLGVSDAHDDVDLDGHAAWEEYIAGTDPAQRPSVFQWTAVSQHDVSNELHVLQWASATGRVYTVLRMTNLVSGQASVLASDIPASPPVNTWTNDASANRLGFYGVRVSWPGRP